MANYSKFEPSELREILSHYDLSLISAAPIKGGMANTSYLINGEYVLTALDNHNAESALQLAQTMRHLQNFGVPTPQPIVSSSGDDVILFMGRPIILKPFLATIETPSHELERSNRVGKILAQLHTIPVPEYLEPLGRRIPANALQVLDGFKCSDLKDAVHLVQTTEFERMLEQYPSGFCHGDLMSDNVLELKNGTLVPIDWETATADSVILDVGIAAVSAVKSNLDVDEFLDRLLAGYHTASGELRLQHEDARRATGYACVLMSYHRFVRQNINFPNPSNGHIYKDLLPYPMQLGAL